MEAYMTQISNYLLGQSWQIAILVVVVAAVSRLLRKKSAHTRYLLWLIVLAKCLVPPVTTVPLAVLPQARLPKPITDMQFREPVIDFEMEITQVKDARLSLPSIVEAAQQPIVSDAVSRLTARQWASIGWIAGVTVFILVAVIKALRTQFWLRRERKPLPVELEREIEDVSSCFKIRISPKLCLVEGIGQPFVWGLLRGSIYLPGNFAEVNGPENRRAVLGHELSHVVRFDTVVNLLQVVSQAIFWFHPFVWWANKRIRAEREKCCDEMAITCLSAKASDYSTAIVNMLITEHKSIRSFPSLAVAGPVKNIEERIKTMTRPGKKFYKRPSLITATAVLLLALLSVPATFVLTARAQRPEPVAAEPRQAGAGTIPKANLEIPDDLKPCAEVLRKIYVALKRYEKDKGDMPDWLSDLVPDYLSSEMLIWPEDGPGTTPLAPEPHLPCSFGYQYSNQTTSPGGGTFYRQFKDEERKIWGGVVPLVRYYVGQKCLNISFDGEIYFSGTAWEKEIPTLSGEILTELKTTFIQVPPTPVSAPIKIQPGVVKSEVLAFDGFDGKLGLKWDILNPDRSHYSLSRKPGTLTITTQDGHFKEAKADYKNVFLIDTPVLPGRDFQITTCLLAFKPLEPYNQAGLICWDDDDNYLEWIYQMMDRRGLNFNAGVEANCPTRYTYIPSDRSFEKLWLRVIKRGNSYECSSSTDGESFAIHTVEHWGDGSPKRVGLFALNGSLTHPPEVDASFDFFEVSEITAAVVETPVSRPKFSIPPANLQIPDEMKGCSENLRAIYIALREYEKDKGRMPDWLSQLVPDYLNKTTLLCPDDASHKARYWPDPKLPCSYCYELNPIELRGRPPLDKTMLHYKTLQRGLFGDVVPIVRCFHHGVVLNLSWDGRLYTSAVMFERLFIPNYNHNMLFSEESPNVFPSGEPQYDVDLEAFIKEMDRTYPFFELKGIRSDWEQAKKQLRYKVQSCKSGEQFLEIVTEAILCLRDSHMWFRDAKAQVPQRPKKYYPGISFIPATNERVLVISCREGLDPDLKTGTIVSRIDGKNARHYLEEQAEARWAEGGISGPQRARLFAYRIPLCGEKRGEKHTLTILADGKQRQIELSSEIEARGWPHWYNRPAGLKQVGSCSYTILPSRIGYIYLRRIDGNTGPGMKEAFSTYPEAKGWIIDLCGNGGGGYDQNLHEVLRALPGPMAVIIDAGCMSAGETMARDLVRQGKARLFGSKTAGASSSKRTWTFPSGIASLSVPVRSRWGIDGKPIEFLGIEPHVKVEVVPEELERGLNSAILRAEEYIVETTSAEAQ